MPGGAGSGPCVHRGVAPEDAPTRANLLRHVLVLSLVAVRPAKLSPRPAWDAPGGDWAGAAAAAAVADAPADASPEAAATNSREITRRIRRCVGQRHRLLKHHV